MTSDTWSLFHQAIFVIGFSQIIYKAIANATHSGQSGVLINALMKPGPGSMPNNYIKGSESATII